MTHFSPLGKLKPMTFFQSIVEAWGWFRIPTYIFFKCFIDFYDADLSTGFYAKGFNHRFLDDKCRIPTCFDKKRGDRRDKNSRRNDKFGKIIMMSLLLQILERKLSTQVNYDMNLAKHYAETICTL